jgi:peptidoglycan hydrolase-like protein with peptidoglycan-binding domain
MNPYRTAAVAVVGAGAVLGGALLVEAARRPRRNTPAPPSAPPTAPATLPAAWRGAVITRPYGTVWLALTGGLPATTAVWVAEYHDGRLVRTYVQQGWPHTTPWVGGSATRVPTPAPTPTAAACAAALARGSLVLRAGSQGPCVRTVQAQLNAWGARYGYAGWVQGRPLVVDGIFGPVTATAVRVVQQRIGIPVSGTVGAVTWTYLVHLAPPGAGLPSAIPTTGFGGTGGGCGPQYRRLETTAVYAPLAWYAGHWVACVANPPARLPSIDTDQVFLPAPQCTLEVSLGPARAVQGRPVAGWATLPAAPTALPPFNPAGVTYYAVAHYDMAGRPTAQEFITLQLNDPGPPGTVTSWCLGIFNPVRVPAP